MALGRFHERRGNPRTIPLANGWNFVQANQALNSLSQQQIMRELAHEGILWYFNPPSSPHVGSIFESMVKQVKRDIDYHNDQVLPEETLIQTLLSHVEPEAIVQS